MNIIDYFKNKLRKKKKRDWETDPYSDHPVHEHYVKQEPTKK